MSLQIAGLKKGDALPEMTRKVVQDRIKDYAEASGDFNPIHLDPDFATGTPMGGTIAHGMLILAYVSDYMTGLFGEPWVTGGKLNCRFKDPARPGDILTLSGTVSGVEQTGNTMNVSASVVCANQKGEIVLNCDTGVFINTGLEN